jgi:hypothetical protein
MRSLPEGHVVAQSRSAPSPGHRRPRPCRRPLVPVIVVDMATWEDVRLLASRLPETAERETGRGTSEWRVRDQLFVWERPLRVADLEALGDDAPAGPVLAARVDGLVAKDALLADDPDRYFTTPHFDGYPMILVDLERISVEELEELIVEAWSDRAPRRLVEDHADTILGRRRPG